MDEAEFEATPYEMQTIVQFPRILNLRRLDDMFDYIAEHVPARVNYVGEVSNIFDGLIPDETRKVFKTRDKEYGEIRGTVRTSNPFAGTMFRVEHGGKSEKYFDKLVFETPGKDGLEEISQEELDLMDKVRETIDDYFAENSRVNLPYGL